MRSAMLLFILLISPVAMAHKKWFYDASPYPLRWDLFWRPLPLTITLLVLLVTAGAAFLQHKRAGRGFLPTPTALGATPERLSKIYALMPAFLAVHLAVPLLINGVHTQLFSPNNDLPVTFLGLLQISVALAFFYGGFTRVAALALAALWALGALLLGLQPMLENAHYLGYAGFFYLAGRGPLSVDRLMLPRLEPSPELMRHALSALRIGAGVSLIVVAFNEKLANLPFAEAFIRAYPLNFTSELMFPFSLTDEFFLVSAGGTELLIGLFLVLNIFTREIVVVAWLFFNLTLTIFNATELINHLPFFGVMAMLLVWSPERETKALWVKGLSESLLPVIRGGRAEVSPLSEVTHQRAK
ncbi:MAG: DoxX protein [Deinococcota bacterium]|nr:DoxX protein [Deinococcota bacterium]